MKIVIAAVLFTLLIFSPTQASLIDHGNFTTDNVSGLDWLDTAFTDGMSYNYVTANPGFNWFGDGSSWRVATHTETINMLTSALGHSPVSGSSLSNGGLTQELHRTLGKTFEYEALLPISPFSVVYQYDRVRMQTSTIDPSDSTKNMEVSVTGYTNYPGHPEQIGNDNVNMGLSGNRAFANYQTAIAIVRDSVIPVPEPSAILLFGIGMLGLAGINRKKYKNLSK